jgi:hypothetical protein
MGGWVGRGLRTRKHAHTLASTHTLARTHAHARTHAGAQQLDRAGLGRLVVQAGAAHLRCSSAGCCWAGPGRAGEDDHIGSNLSVTRNQQADLACVYVNLLAAWG